jgi:hypothetical protein
MDSHFVKIVPPTCHVMQPKQYALNFTLPCVSRKLSHSPGCVANIRNSFVGKH